ncbi:MAG: extracellular solute-binding protein [Thermotogae bacterium]|nr:extracellular solute-binding protein [Thermotogota bacterium]
MRRLILIFSLMFSCSRGDTSYQIWHAMGGPLGDAFSYVISGTKLKEVSFGSYNTLAQRLVSAAMSRKLPLIAQTFPSWSLEFYDKGLILNVKEIVPESLLKKIHPKLLAEVETSDVLLAIPFNKSVPVLFYNADLMDSLGLNPPRTWEDLKDVCVEAKRRGVWGFAFSIDPWIFYTIFRQKGGTGLNFNSPEGIAALEFLRDLVLKDSCAYLGSGYSHQDDFASRRVLMIWATSVSYVFMKPKITFHMRAAPIPTDRYDSVVISGTNLSVFVGHSPQEYKEVIRFLERFLSDSVQRYWSAHTGYAPVTRLELADEELKEVFAQIDRATYEPRSSLWMRARRYFATEVMEPVLKGVLPPKKALNRYEILLKTLNW